VLGLLAVGAAATLSAVLTAPSAGRQRLVAPTLVTVTAGKPTEYAFKLSKASNLPWDAASRTSPVTFNVANAGKVAHAFKVCADPVESALTNSCRGKGTKTLRPGQSARLTITFTARGTYEYLSNVAGQAAKGMKGVIGIGIALPKAKTTTPKTTTPGTTTPSSPSTPSAPSTPSTPSTPSAPLPDPGAGGDPVAGAAVWVSAGCRSCHSLSEVRGNTGADLNAIHPGDFENGPLTSTQLRDLIAYLRSQ
jgi:uncharacterized cupredoxin-like copper-binding protein